MIVGLRGYYHMFLHNYGKIMVPLTNLLKNNSFSCIPTVDQSFQALKEDMCATPIMALSDFIKTFLWNVMH
jgi:hypothetical protein